jgi:hypothetical protein
VISAPAIIAAVGQTDAIFEQFCPSKALRIVGPLGPIRSAFNAPQFFPRLDDVIAFDLTTKRQPCQGIDDYVPIPAAAAVARAGRRAPSSWWCSAGGLRSQRAQGIIVQLVAHDPVMRPFLA